MLERNMSLSSQYLEELSRRYKKQVEEMQRLLENTITSLKEESKRKDEENRRLQQQLTTLTAIVDSLVAEKSSWIQTTYWLFLTGIATIGILTFCRRNPEIKRNNIGEEMKIVEVQRRKSIDVVSHDTKPTKVRRPSEEALKISGSYQHLMVASDEKKEKRKRKKKRQALQRSNSITTLSEETGKEDEQQQQPLAKRNLWLKEQPSSNDWIINSRTLIEDVPFVLEESEHTFLEPLPYQHNGTKEQKFNGNVSGGIPSLPYIKTAINSRLARTSSHNIINGNKINHNQHKKSSSVDETTKMQESSEVSSVNSSSFEEKASLKKEKKGAFRRIFKKVF